MQKPSIFKFKDYRAFLHASLEFHRSIDRKYSLIYFSTRIERSASYLKLVMNGKRELNLDSAAMLGKVLRLNPMERAYFINLVLKESATSSALKTYVSNRMVSLKREGMDYQPTQKLASIFQSSLVWEIFSMVGLDGFEANTKWILPRLRRREKSAARVEEVIRQLETLGALEHVDGKVKAKDVVLKHGFDMSQIYIVAMQRAIEQLTALPADPSAYFDSFCLILSEPEFEQIKEILEETKLKVGQVARGRNAPKTRIAYFNSSLFLASYG